MAFLRLFAFVFAVTAISYAGVSVSAPSSGSSSGSPAHFVASASGTHPIDMSSSSHSTLVHALDPTGAVIKASPMAMLASSD